MNANFIAVNPQIDEILYNFYQLIQMRTQRRVSFNYHHNNISRSNNQPCLSTHHLIHSHQILKFNYQLSNQPRIQKIKTFHSVSFDNSLKPVEKVNALPTMQSEKQSRGSKKINLVMLSVRKEKQKDKGLPQLLQQVVDSQHQQSVCQKIIVEKQANQKIQNKVQSHLNPQSHYRYSLPNHIQQQQCQLNCDLFSACKEPHQIERENKGQGNLDIAKQFTNSQILPDKNQLATRQKIFQSIPLQKQRKTSLINAEEWANQKINQRATENIVERRVSNSMNRRRVFSEIQPPKPRLFKMVQVQIENEQIPQLAKDNWQRENHNNIKEWQVESPTLNASPEGRVESF